MKWSLLASVALAATLGGCSLGGADRKSSGDAAEVPFRTSGWKTDFAEHSVPLDEFVGGGPPKDGISSIDHPVFVGVDRADRFLDPREAIAVLELGGRIHAYPLQIMVWHEIVNDVIAGQPVALTYCPLCNSTVAFRREVDGRPVEFGTTGMLRNSDLVMYDRETESWWQQLTADAVVGELTGNKLDVLPSQILSWEELRRQHPDAAVLSRDTGFDRDYGRNPYAGYDSDPDAQPFLLNREADRSLPPLERVAAIQTGDRSAVVYPFSRLAGEAPVNDEIDGRPIVVFFDPDVASPLDSPVVSEGRDVGAAAVFAREVDGRALEFEPSPGPGGAIDSQTRSVWNLGGRATAGPLEGARLDPIPHDDQFWFALAAFFADAEIRG